MRYRGVVVEVVIHVDSLLGYVYCSFGFEETSSVIGFEASEGWTV